MTSEYLNSILFRIGWISDLWSMVKEEQDGLKIEKVVNY